MELVWHDANGGEGWKEIKDIDFSLNEVVSVGAVIRSDKTAILLAQSIDNSSHLVDGILIVPWVNVQAFADLG